MRKPPRRVQCGSHLILGRCWKACGAKVSPAWLLCFSRVSWPYMMPGNWLISLFSDTCQRYLATWPLGAAQLSISLTVEVAGQELTGCRLWQPELPLCCSAQRASISPPQTQLMFSRHWCRCVWCIFYTFDQICGERPWLLIACFCRVFLLVPSINLYFKKANLWYCHIMFFSWMILISGTTCVAAFSCWNNLYSAVSPKSLVIH